MFPDMRLDAFDLEWQRGPRVKVVFVHSKKDIRAVWNRLQARKMSKAKMGDSLGFCHQCWHVSEKNGVETMVVDPRYAAWVVLLVPRLTIEVCAHEAFHAGLAVMRRRLRNPDACVSGMDIEEEAAYPAGKIAQSAIKLAVANGWLRAVDFEFSK
jgi:hypothetical protein